MSTPLCGLSSLATRAVLAELAEAWRCRAGDSVHFESVGGVDASRRVLAGEQFDIVVLASYAIDDLATSGAVLPHTKTDVVCSPVAIAVRAGAPKPAIATEAGLREAVSAARSIGYSTGPSGIALRRLFERWGISTALRERLVRAPPGTPVARLIASGDVELGFQQWSELAHVDGVDVIGTMPAGLEIITTFSAAQCTISIHSPRVRALLDFLRAPDVGDIKRRHHMLAA